MLVEETGYENCQEGAQDFLNQIWNPNPQKISYLAYSYSMMYLMKINELAESFFEHHGLSKLQFLLEGECLGDYQLAYNVLVILWILSYHSDV